MEEWVRFNPDWGPMESGRPAIVDIYEQWADKAQDGRTGKGTRDQKSCRALGVCSTVMIYPEFSIALRKGKSLSIFILFRRRPAWLQHPLKNRVNARRNPE